MTSLTQNCLASATKSSEFFEEVSEQAGHSYCGPAGGYEDIVGKTRTERHVPLEVVSSEQQKTCTYLVPDRSKKASLRQMCVNRGVALTSRAT